MTDTPIIAIDGKAASGKGTLARRLAARLGYTVLDTGALYRLVALRMKHARRDPEDRESAIELARALRHQFTGRETEDPEIRTDEIGQWASLVAAVPDVRDELLILQRNFAKNPPPTATGEVPNGAILDGRDIGTVVCPDADIKLFITAKPEIRAKRRYKELHSASIPVTYEAVLEDMRRRDARDAGRKTAPMKPASDAYIIDTSDMTPEEVFEEALSYIDKVLETGS